MIYYGGIKFPLRAVIFLALESDSAFNSSSGHSAKEKALLVLE
jgi:hypothetical protein